MAEYTDTELNELVYKAIVPKGLRPETSEDADAMLDAIGGDMPSEDTVQRMLRKIRGEESIGVQSDSSEADCFLNGNETIDLPEAEMALYRNRNDDIPPEVDKLLKDMEQEALENSEENEDKDEGEPDSKDA